MHRYLNSFPMVFNCARHATISDKTHVFGWACLGSVGRQYVVKSSSRQIRFQRNVRAQIISNSDLGSTLNQFRKTRLPLLGVSTEITNWPFDGKKIKKNTHNYKDYVGLREPYSTRSERAPPYITMIKPCSTQ